MNRLTGISSKKIISFVTIGILVSLFAALFISWSLSDVVGEEIQSRDLEFLFGAVESGPLALARLQSASIAQQALVRIMANPKFKDRGIQGVEILGGENGLFSFANWQSRTPVNPKCIKQDSRSYVFSESINNFKINISRDSCFEIKEKKAILYFSSSASLLVTIISIILLACSIWPVAKSVQQAELVLSGKTQDFKEIYFLPIKNLIKIAMRNAELEKGKALADLATQLSHDIRSPLSVLNIVISSIDLSKEKRELINSSVGKINEMAMSLLKTNRSQTDYRITDIAAVTKKLVYEKIKEFENRKKIAIGFKTDGSKFNSYVDPLKLSAVLSNLINNSAEAIPLKGQITVRVLESEDKNIISVADTGVGISVDIMSRIGEKGLTFGKLEGNGLGLYSAKKFVEESQGKFHVVSSPGSGTLITLAFPRLKS